ncbi:MAG: flagellar hook-length control protein FliK [Sphingobium sp.]
MGKLGNSVAQLLMPTATKAGMGDATTAGAALPTAFAALLSNVAVSPKVGSIASDQPKSVETPNASSSAVASNDMLVAELPLGDLSSAVSAQPAPAKGSPRLEAVSLPKGASKMAGAPAGPKSAGHSSSGLEPSQPAVEPISAEAGPEAVQSASNQPVSPSRKPVIEQKRSPISMASLPHVKLRSKHDVEPETTAKAAVASDENPADGDVASALGPQPVDPTRALDASLIVIDAGRISASAPTPKAPSDLGGRPSARTSSGPGKNQEPVVPMAAKESTVSDSATRLAPNELPPEFAAVLAASTKARSKPVGSAPEQAASKATAPQGDVAVFAKAASVKDATLAPPLLVDHPRTKTSVVTADEASAAPTITNAQPVTASVSPQAPSMPSGPVADLSASLGQQVIDMGSGGQWIEGLAHEIAALSKGEGHGSFRLSPEHLGPMRVDIRPGDQGASVTLTVETKAAESMLMQDRNILKADAQLAAVKIGDVTVERVAHVHESGRADTATGQGTGQGQGQGQTSSQTASQGHGGDGSNQAALAQGQGQSQQNGNHAGSRKVSSDAAVSSQAEPREAGDRDIPDASRRARYA